MKRRLSYHLGKPSSIDGSRCMWVRFGDFVIALTNQPKSFCETNGCTKYISIPFGYRILAFKDQQSTEKNET